MSYIFGGFKIIGEVFAGDPGIWWFLAPILILWFASQVYFGEYKKERVGFAGVFSSGISFTWINISTLRILFMNQPDDIWTRFYILLIFLLYGLFLIYNSFFHKLELEHLGILASPNTINPLSIVVILFGQGYVEVSLVVIFDVLIIFGCFWLLFFFLKKKFLGVPGDVEAIKAGELPKELEEEKKRALNFYKSR